MVSKTDLIIRSNIKKSHRQLIAVICLMILSSLLMNAVFILQFDYNQTFDRDRELTNSMDFRLSYINLSGMDQYAILSDCLAGDERIAEYEIDEVCMGDGDAEFADGSVSSLIVLDKYSSAMANGIDRYEIIEEDESVADGVYAGYLFKAAGMKTGDLCHVSVGKDSFVFRIKGFYNSPVIGTVNCGGIAYIVSDGLYDELTADKPVSYLIKVICRDKNEVVNVYVDTADAIGSMNMGGYISHFAFPDDIGTSRYSNSNIFRIVLMIAAVTMTIIMLAIIAIVISNYVNDNIRSFGTMKAVGYTSRMLIVPLLIEVGAMCLISGMIGTAASYAVFPIINKALESQVGIPYEIRFLPLPCLMSVAICEITSVISAFLSVRRIRSIASVNAIRDVREVSGRVTDVLRLDRSAIGVNPAIGLNSALKSVSRGMILFFTFVGISFLLSFSLFIYQNFIVDNTAVVKVICGEIPNYIVSVDKADETDLTEFLDSHPMVENHYFFTMEEQIPVGSLPVIEFYGIEKNGFVTTLDYLLVDGAFPQNDNEITLNKLYAETNGIKLNDELRFANENGEFVYRVVGFNQGASRGGTEGYILRAGLEKISTSHGASYNVFLHNVGDEEEFRSDVMTNCPILYLQNSRENVSSMVNMYMLILIVLAIVLCIVSVLVVVFVLYVLLSLLLNNKRREHGILKAIGFTTWDVVIQTETAILPFCVFGSAVGLICSKNLVGELISVALNSIGIYDFGGPLKLVYLLILWIVQSVFAASLSALLCRPVSKISTHELFNRE